MWPLPYKKIKFIRSKDAHKAKQTWDSKWRNRILVTRLDSMGHLLTVNCVNVTVISPMASAKNLTGECLKCLYNTQGFSCEQLGNKTDLHRTHNCFNRIDLPSFVWQKTHLYFCNLKNKEYRSSVAGTTGKKNNPVSDKITESSKPYKTGDSENPHIKSAIWYHIGHIKCRILYDHNTTSVS